MTGRSWESFYSGLMEATWRSRPDSAFWIRRARSFIDRNYAGPLDLQGMAQWAHFSRFHFIRLFKEAFEETPNRYLQSRRLAEARRLLRTTDLPVTEICFRVGFQSLGSFSRLFSERVGESPVRYRRRVFPVVKPSPAVVPIPGCFLRAFGVVG